MKTIGATFWRVAANVLFVLLGIYSLGYTGSAFFGPVVGIDLAASTDVARWFGYWEKGYAVAFVTPEERELPPSVPGPADPWAGARAHGVEIPFDVPAGEYQLRLDIFDRHDTAPPTIDLTLDGAPLSRVGLTPGHGAPAPYVDPPDRLFDRTFPLTAGAHRLAIANVAGSWFAPAHISLMSTDVTQPKWRWFVDAFEVMPGQHAVAALLALAFIICVLRALYRVVDTRSPTSGAILRAFTGDAPLATLLFSAAYLFGVWYMAEWGGAPKYYQNNFGASVMWACGHGFVSPDLDTMPRMNEFLGLDRPSFACADIPADPPTTEMWTFTRTHFYLASSLAFLWWLFGVNWVAVYPLYGLCFGGVVAATYLLFRFAMGKPLALIGALWIALSPFHLAILPHLRDYSKAPFLLSVIAALALVATRSFGTGRLIALAAGIGLVTGVGLGFRADLIIVVPFAALVIFLLQPGFDRRRLGVKALAFGALVTVMYLAAYPIFAATARNNSHAVIMGMGRGFDPLLRVESPSLYRVNAFYHDQYTLTLVNAFLFLNRESDDFTPLPGFNSTEYEKNGRDFYLKAFSLFPADMVLRLFAASRNVADLPFDPDSRRPPGVAFDGIEGANRAYDWLYETVKAPLYGWGVAFVVAALFALALYRVRLLVVALLFSAFLSMYPGIQYFNRHVFHLEFITIFCVGLLLHGGWRLAKERESPLRHANGRERSIGVALVLGTLLLSWGAIAGSRAYQASTMEETIARYVDLPLSPPLTPLASTDSESDGTTLVTYPLFGPRTEAQFDATYLRADIDHDACPGSRRSVTLVYGPRLYDFSEQIGNDAVASAGRSVFYFPVTHSIYSPYVGVRVDDTAADCLTVRKVTAPPGLPLVLFLPEKWKECGRYQTFAWEGRDDPC